jgi:hypothetical protein
MRCSRRLGRPRRRPGETQQAYPKGCWVSLRSTQPTFNYIQHSRPRGGRAARGDGRRGRASRLAPGGHDQDSGWARWTPCPAASDGRSTLGRPGHHAVRGIGDRLRRSPHPLVLERASRESPAPSPPSPRSEVRGAGARLVWPPCRARCRTAALGSWLRGGPRSPPVSSPRPAHESTLCPRCHH